MESRLSNKKVIYLIVLELPDIFRFLGGSYLLGTRKNGITRVPWVTAGTVPNDQ